MAETGATRKIGRIETLGDFREARDMLDDRKHLTELLDVLENKVSSTAVYVEFETAAPHTDGGGWMRLRLPRHVIDAMKTEIRDRMHALTGLLVRNYGIKDA